MHNCYNLIIINYSLNISEGKDNILATISAYYPKDLFEDDPNGKFKAGVGNLWSLISYPATGDFWLAIEDFPANQGKYHKFNLFELLK